MARKRRWWLCPLPMGVATREDSGDLRYVHLSLPSHLVLKANIGAALNCWKPSTAFGWRLQFYVFRYRDNARIGSILIDLAFRGREATVSSNLPS
ncbi:hypothetical protein F5890DRAFT_360017 [Lentinula detonsa]|uniref:Uncharacterized protein n=1 Tax=Lentinula detonsa TaxID=2804962 RepID=A0AA38PVK5_9AGAR|nr:hypothetical protein F5890DRAFT_360017 [Lentinula detonsa]